MNGVGRWRCYLGWMLIHTFMMTSLITRDRLRYTRAFCLDLFGSVMFPNNSVDSVPAVYLIFLDNMLNVLEDGYDWG
jgi:hypothetical protein